MRWEGVQLLLKSKLEVAVSYSCQLQLSVTEELKLPYMQFSLHVGKF